MTTDHSLAPISSCRLNCHSLICIQEVDRFLQVGLQVEGKRPMTPPKETPNTIHDSIQPQQDIIPQITQEKKMTRKATC